MEKSPRERVHLSESLDYDDVCSWLSKPALLERWQLLGDAMAYRAGWHFRVVNDGEPLWCYGAFGASVLSIYVEDSGRFACLDYFDDVTEHLSSLDEVLAWVDAHEGPAALRLSAPYELLAADDWALLGKHVLDVDVTWFDGVFAASVRSIPGDAAMQPDLVSAIKAAALVVTEHVGAPPEKARLVPFRVHLDEAATSALTA